VSHKKTIRTEYRDAECLEEAFREAAQAQGFQSLTGATHAQMYNGERVPVAMRIQRNRQSDSWYYGDFGLAKGDGVYTIVIDDLDIGRPKVQAFLNDLAQRYTYKATLKTLAAQGYAVTEQRQADGTIKLIARPTRRTATRQTTRSTATRQVATVRR
jgi:hypothetical protein